MVYSWVLGWFSLAHKHNVSITSENTRDISSICIISKLNKEFPVIWLVEWFLTWRYNIFEAWPLSLPPLPSRQVNTADSCEWIFHLFGRDHCKSRIFERMENFQSDCCRPWTEKPFNNAYSRQLRIVNPVASWSPAGQIDWPKSVFLQIKATHFETMMTTVDEVNRYKTKVRINFFVMFRLSVLLLTSMSKLIHNQCTCKLIINTLRLHTCV